VDDYSSGRGSLPGRPSTVLPAAGTAPSTVPRPPARPARVRKRPAPRFPGGPPPRISAVSQHPHPPFGHEQEFFARGPCRMAVPQAVHQHPPSGAVHRVRRRPELRPAARGWPGWVGGGQLPADLTLPKLPSAWTPRPRPPERFTTAERNAILGSHAAPAPYAAAGTPLYLPDDPCCCRCPPGCGPTLCLAAGGAWQTGCSARRPYSFDPCRACPFVRFPPVYFLLLYQPGPVTRLCPWRPSGDETVRGPDGLVLQLSRLALAVAELRDAPRHAAQAASAPPGRRANCAPPGALLPHGPRGSWLARTGPTGPPGLSAPAGHGAARNRASSRRSRLGHVSSIPADSTLATRFQADAVRRIHAASRRNPPIFREKTRLHAMPFPWAVMGGSAETEFTAPGLDGVGNSRPLAGANVRAGPFGSLESPRRRSRHVVLDLDSAPPLSCRVTLFADGSCYGGCPSLLTTFRSESLDARGYAQLSACRRGGGGLTSAKASPTTTAAPLVCPGFFSPG